MVKYHKDIVKEASHFYAKAKYERKDIRSIQKIALYNIFALFGKKSFNII